MKIRTLLLGGALAAAALGSSLATPATAWTCPEPFTQPYYVTNPVTGGQQRICTPYLSCETCWADVR